MHLSGMKIGLIANANAGLVSRAYLETQDRRIDKLLRAHGQPAMHRTADREELRTALTNLRRAGIGTLAIRGGDGTLRLTITEALNVWGSDQLPTLLPLRGGTNNVIPASFGWTGDPAGNLQRFLQRHPVRAMRVMQVPLLKVNGAYGFIFGCGTFSRFLEAYYAGGTPSRWGGFKLFAKTAAAALWNNGTGNPICAGITARLEIDNAPVQTGCYTLLTASCVRHVGLGFHPYFLAQGNPARLHFLLATATPRRLIANAVNFYLGRTSSTADIVHQAGTRMVLHFDEPTRFSLDGDLIDGGQRITVESGPTVSLLTPHKEAD